LRFPLHTRLYLGRHLNQEEVKETTVQSDPTFTHAP
jgi:hypothetical protein